jgi:prolipoprotein diacylglyceryltransferase
MAAYIVHNIDPFFIKVGDRSVIGGIHWYGVCYAVSFVIALLMMYSYSKRQRSPLSNDQNALFLSYANHWGNCRWPFGLHADV